MRNETSKLPAVALLSLVALAFFAAPASAIGPSRNESAVPGGGTYVPRELATATVNEKLGATIPLDLTFTDESGQDVQLARFFTGKRPVVLQIGYYGCPMLCDLVSQGLVAGVKKLPLEPGKDFEVIYLSFDPREKASLAAQKKDSYLKEYGRPHTAAGWHFLTGKPDAIHALTNATGYGYKWVESAAQYSHPAVLILLSPEGKITRYLYGVKFDDNDSKTLRLSLVEASDGKIGSSTDKFILTCLRWDGHQGKYAASALAIMRIAGILTVLIVAAMIIRAFVREARRRRAGGEGRGFTPGGFDVGPQNP